MIAAGGGIELVLGGIVVSVVLAAIKIIAGVVGHSYALVADGIESCLDVFSSAVVWAGMRFAARPPDENHPYGHGKAESLACLVVGLALWLAAGLLAWHSVKEILTPHHAPAPFTLAVLIVVVIVKEGWSRLILRKGHHLGSPAMQADAWHHRADAITSTAAFLGISVALIGGKGFEAADDWAALLACGILVLNGFHLIRPALADMLDESASSELIARMRQEAMMVEGVLALDKCRVRRLGGDCVVEIHIRVPPNMSVIQGHQVAHQVKDRLMQAGLRVVDCVVHVEPVPLPQCGEGSGSSAEEEGGRFS